MIAEETKCFSTRSFFERPDKSRPSRAPAPSYEKVKDLTNRQETFNVTAHYCSGAVVWRWWRLLRLLPMGEWWGLGSCRNDSADRPAAVPVWRIARVKVYDS